MLISDPIWDLAFCQAQIHHAKIRTVLQSRVCSKDIFFFSFSDPPAFNKARCKVNNTTIVLGWFAPETKCCVDYYVLEVDMVKSSEYATRRKKDRKFKRLYEGPAREYALYSVPYSVNIITRVYGVNPTGEGTPSEELVISTPKGSCYRVLCFF